MKTFSHFADNKKNNFNLIRFIAALLVLYVHSYGLLGLLPHKGGQPFAYFIYLLGNVGVDLFFLVSGFLITRSYLSRQNVTAFLWARFLRIYPALIVAIVFTVCIIGFLDTDLSPKDYFLHQQTWSYILYNISMLGADAFLPGVFDENVYKNLVNGSLWTLPVEVCLYLCVVVMGSLGVFFKTKYINILFCLLLIIYCEVLWFFPSILVDSIYQYPVLLFFLGCLFYVNKEWVPVSGYIVTLLLSALVYMLYYQEAYKGIIYTVSIFYAVFWLAYAVPCLNFFNKLGDYSYGLYIYAFPIQQLIANRMPHISVDLFFLLSFLLSLVMAIFSWHLIEKKALRLKR